MGSGLEADTELYYNAIKLRNLSTVKTRVDQPSPDDKSKKSACETYQKMLENPPTKTLIDCRSAYERGQTRNYHEFFSRQTCRSVTSKDNRKLSEQEFACLQEDPAYHQKVQIHK